MPTPFQSRSFRRAALAGSVGILCALSAACAKPLLNADEERSQFTRYDRVREIDQPSYLVDEFGRRVPNLRGRLRPHE